MSLLIFGLVGAASVLGAGKAEARSIRIFPADYEPHLVCDQRPESCIEIVRLRYEGAEPPRAVALLIPGFFQNGEVFDILPEEGISFARMLSNELGVQVYFLHVRGIGNSDRPHQWDLDDIAADDIPRAIEYVSAQEGGRKILVAGHSQGGITLLASMAGLDRCGDDGNCFSKNAAAARQAHVAAILPIAANVTMRTEWRRNRLRLVAKFGNATHWLTETATGFVPARAFIQDLFRGPLSLAYGNIWRFLYSPGAVSADARRALYFRTLDGTYTRLIQQFAFGVLHGGIRDSAGERYTDHLGNVVVPIWQVSFGLDALAEPEATRADTFEHLGSAQKHYQVFDGQRHEDFMMIPGMAEEFRPILEQMIQTAQRR